MNQNENLHKALKNKNDEFYTRYEDVEKECSLYASQFEGKIIFLPADDETSAFWKYFNNNFDQLKVKGIVATHLEEEGNSYALGRFGSMTQTVPLRDNGDFFGKEAQSLLAICDIVITNPPFSLFRKIVNSIASHQKKFLLIANENTIGSKEIFPMFMNNDIFFGENSVKSFIQPDGTEKTFGNIIWLTNLEIQNKKKIVPSALLQEKIFYDNYQAINIDKVKDIPKDYFDVMGVPITYLKKHNSDLFEILGIASGISKANKLYGEVIYYPNDKDRGGAPLIDGKIKYTRVFIKRKGKQ